MAEKKKDKSSWAVAGGLLLGMGAGFLFMNMNPLALIGCTLGGLGLGLIVSSSMK